MHPGARFIQSYVPHRCIGVLVEFGLENWHVIVCPGFLELSRGLAVHIAYSNPESLNSLLQQAYFNDPSVRVQKTLADASGRLAMVSASSDSSAGEMNHRPRRQARCLRRIPLWAKDPCAALVCRL